ncbi:MULTISPECIES: thioredoxin-like domain-containing protein [unclassified Schlesneria]|uniref:thioredoxin-like domain-containing protein n=1 Tax=Schlesneria TaxID=656899 RepID=UPI002F223644
MTSQSFRLMALLVASSAMGSSAWAADPPKVADTMAFVPRQKDVEFETPKPADYAKCKVEVERRGKINGWVVLGPAGQVLRKFLDTDGVGGIDQWRYYNHGVEVYRDIDTNNNNKVDQCRWLNLGGTRWGIDSNEDGRIDEWKILSAAEASKEALRALITGDEAAFQSIMINEDDLKSLGVDSRISARLLEAAADPGKKAKAVMAKTKTLSAQSRWTRFDAQMPSLIPADDEKAKGDLLVYESAMAIVETQSKFNAVQIGEMIRVGDVWKLTQVPTPIEGEVMTTSGGILMEPIVASSTITPGPAGPSPKVEKILKELQEIETSLMKQGQPPEQVKTLMTKRAALLKEAIELAETDEEKSLLMKQTVDGYALASQMGTFPEGVAALKEIETDLTKAAPDSPLLPYTTYRLLQAEYYVNLQAAEEDKDKQAEVQKAWLEGLDSFVTKYPTSDDADDAMVMLGTHEELQGRSKEATEWYQRLLKEKPKSAMAPRAQGALKRLRLNGQNLALSGPGLGGGVVDVKSLKGQVVLVVFWASEYKVCEDDVPQLRALYQDNKAKGFEIVGVSLDFDKSTALPFVQKHKMNWKHIYQPNQTTQSGGLNSPIAESFGIISLPTMFLVDREGKVVNRNATLTDVKTELPNLLKTGDNVAQGKKAK